MLSDKGLDAIRPDFPLGLISRVLLVQIQSPLWAGPLPLDFSGGEGIPPPGRACHPRTIGLCGTTDTFHFPPFAAQLKGQLPPFVSPRSIGMLERTAAVRRTRSCASWVR